MTNATITGSASFYDGKAHLYSGADHGDVVTTVLSVLPAGGRVLDVGCGSGDILRQLAGRAGYRAGVELSEVAAAEAAQVADEVANMSVTAELPFPRASFDVVVCADILEHLPDPARALSWLVGWCRPNGTIVISAPNVANWQARLRLLAGRWDYEDCGLFDSGHLRFFTYRTLLELVHEENLVSESCRPARLPPVGMQLPVVGRLPVPLRRTVGAAWSIVGNRLARRWPTLFAYQFICVARSGRVADGPAGMP